MDNSAGDGRATMHAWWTRAPFSGVMERLIGDY